MKVNNFSKITYHLKSKKLDEKIQMLNEIPTNNTSGIYVIEPESSEIIDTLVDIAPDLTKDEQEDGRDTTGLFAPDGTILTAIPPGDNSYVLGPMSLIRYTYPSISYEIGYIGQGSRRFTALGRISYNQFNFSGWNGESGFTSYGQLTLEQAQWFRERFLENQVSEYRTFLNGPPPYFPYVFPGPDPLNRFLGFIIDVGRQTGSRTNNRIPPTMGGFDSNLPPGSANPNYNKKLDDYIKSLPPGVKDDLLKGGKSQSLLGDLAILGLSAALVKSLTAALSAGAASGILSRLRYLAKLRIDRGALNPLGQTSVRSGAAGRQRVDVYSGRPYQGPRGNRTGTQYGTINPQTGNTYTNPGPLKGMPGTGSQTNPRGTLDTGTLPQRYLDKYGSRSVLGQKQVKMSPSAARRTFGESVETNNYANEFIAQLFDGDINAYDKVDNLIKFVEKYIKNKSSTNNENIQLVAQNHKKILHEIKKPYILPEQTKVKYKIKPKVRSVNSDMMKTPEVPSSFKQSEDRVWGKYEKEKNATLSQQRKNDVMDQLGNSDWHWEYMTETSRQKNKEIQYTNFDDKSEKVKGKIVRKEELKGDHLVFLHDEKTNEKKTMLQSEINELLAQEHMPDEFKMFLEQQNETERYEKDPLFKKVSKRLKKEIDYSDKPAKNGYPNDPPPEMVNGMHPDLVDGKKTADRFNRIDPESAKAMPLTGNPHIDKKVKAATKKPK
jgi:hypothetical protein